MKEQAERHNQGKPKLSMVLEMPNALTGVARVLEGGAEEYGRRNYQKGLPWTEVIDSLMRHLLGYLNGEDLDKKTGLPHADHLACNALFLAEFFRTRPEFDDRAKAEEEPKFMRREIKPADVPNFLENWKVAKPKDFAFTGLDGETREYHTRDNGMWSQREGEDVVTYKTKAGNTWELRRSLTSSGYWVPGLPLIGESVDDLLDKIDAREAAHAKALEESGQAHPASTLAATKAYLSEDGMWVCCEDRELEGKLEPREAFWVYQVQGKEGRGRWAVAKITLARDSTWAEALELASGAPLKHRPGIAFPQRQAPAIVNKAVTLFDSAAEAKAACEYIRAQAQPEGTPPGQSEIIDFDGNKIDLTLKVPKRMEYHTRDNGMWSQREGEDVVAYKTKAGTTWTVYCDQNTGNWRTEDFAHTSSTSLEGMLDQIDLWESCQASWLSAGDGLRFMMNGIHGKGKYEVQRVEFGWQALRWAFLPEGGKIRRSSLGYYDTAEGARKVCERDLEQSISKAVEEGGQAQPEGTPPGQSDSPDSP